MKTLTIPYIDDEVSLEGFAAYPTGKDLPLVILCHAWQGRDDFICNKAKEIAKLGYVGFALDMYGKGVIGRSKEENIALKSPFIKDRQLLQKRVLKGFHAACQLPGINPSKVIVLGYGFGGICALDLARSGADLKGAVSVYGHFDPPPFPVNPIKAKILILHGYNDPVASQEELSRFEKEMDDFKVDWQAHVFGNTYHAFATPGVNNLESGLLYNPLSAKRAWDCIEIFLKELVN